MKKRYRRAKTNYFRLWRNKELSDLSGKPLKIQERFDKIYLLIKIIASCWPIIGAALLSVYLDDIKKSTSLFVNVATTRPHDLTNYSINFMSLIVDFFSFLWLIFFVITIIFEGNFLAIDFRKLRALIIKAPNMKLYQSSRSLLDIAERTIKKFGTFENEYVVNNYSHIDELIVLIKSINFSILEVAQDFFDDVKIVGVNVMIYFENNDMLDTLMVDFNANSNKIYFRCDDEDKLRGVLYLVSGLVKDFKSGRTPSIILPIYSSYAQTYKNPNDEDDDFIIPGAMLAYQKETSMIGDTIDINKFYSTFDDRTKKEIGQFFGKSGVAHQIRSFASFRIPAIDPDSKDYLGILNIDSDVPYSFGENEQFFGTFYTIIYPVLKRLTKWVEFYKNFCILNPTKA